MIRTLMTIQRHAKISGAASGMQMNYFNDKEKGLVRIAMAGSAMLQNDGDIADITFDVSNDIRGKQTSQIAIVMFPCKRERSYKTRNSCRYPDNRETNFVSA